MTTRVHPSNRYSFTMRLRIENKPGKLASVLKAIAAQKGDPGAVDVVEANAAFKVRELSDEYIVPSVFNKQVVRRVARAVEAAAYKGGATTRSQRAHTSNRRVPDESESKTSDHRALDTKAEAKEEKS